MVHVAIHVVVDHEPDGQPHFCVDDVLEQHVSSVVCDVSPAVHVRGEPQPFEWQVDGQVLTLTSALAQQVPDVVSKLAAGQHSSVCESTRWPATAVGQQ